MYLSAHLFFKPQNDYNGVESYLADKIAANDISFFPLHRAICLDGVVAAGAHEEEGDGGGGGGGGSEGLREVRDQVKALEVTMSRVLELLEARGGGGGGGKEG